jgi:S-adenosylmethionine/arginine decarboxylase-like enzyme
LHAPGTPLLVELHGCPPEPLKRVDLVRDILVGAAEACGATIVDLIYYSEKSSCGTEKIMRLCPGVV